MVRTCCCDIKIEETSEDGHWVGRLFTRRFQGSKQLSPPQRTKPKRSGGAVSGDVTSIKDQLIHVLHRGIRND